MQIQGQAASQPAKLPSLLVNDSNRTELDRLLTGFTQQEPRLLSAPREGSGPERTGAERLENNVIIVIITK